MKALFLLLLSPTTSLALELPGNLAKVYSYQCETTFLEGEGMSTQEPSCAAFQQLGLLQAKYTHYLFRSPALTNTQKKATDEFYPDTVCSLPLVRTQCSEKPPELRFGLSATQDETYSVAVSLSPAPGLAPELQGYAAAAAKGKCDHGLELVQAYRAAPKSIQRPLPTTFVNVNGSLDDLIVIAPARKMPRFEVSRQRNTVACDDVGDCSMARFDQAVGVQRVDYTAIGKGVCVIPKSAIPDDGVIFRLRE